jgi:hypothetical protein
METLEYHQKKFRASETTYQKQRFDPYNVEHLRMYQNFIEYKGWGVTGCPFLLEWPFETVPGMIQSRIVKEFLPDIIGRLDAIV